jgi:hypothetical protein
MIDVTTRMLVACSILQIASLIGMAATSYSLVPLLEIAYGQTVNEMQICP